MIHLFDHSYPSTENTRIEFIKKILQSSECEIVVSPTRDAIKNQIQHTNSASLFLLHFSEFQFEDLESIPHNPHAFFIFYSGAGFQNAPNLPDAWENQILCLSPSIDVKQNTNFEALQELVLVFFLSPKINSWADLKINPKFFDMKTFPLLLTHEQERSQNPKDQLVVLHHNMKSLLFYLKKSEKDNRLDTECLKTWNQDFLAPLNQLKKQHSACLASLPDAISKFDLWLKQPPPLNIPEGLSHLKNLRQTIYKLIHASPSPKKVFLDYNRMGRKTEIWVACFHETSVPQCQSLLDHFENSPHIIKTLGPKNNPRNTYLTHHELLDDLRAQKPEQLLDTYIILVCPGSIQPLLNCGHQQKENEDWKADPNTHMGLLSQIIMEFPQLNTHIVYSQKNKSFQQNTFKQELAISIPENIADPDKILEQAFQHHFFEIEYETTELLKSVEHFLQGNRYLFDPTGLRTLLKLRLIANVFAGINEQGNLDLQNTLEQRQVIASRLDHLCLTVDEDLSSATFHGYASYRYGWRAWTITTFKEFDHAHLWRSQAKYKLVIRDTDLRFPDIQAKEPYRHQFGNTNVRYRLECIHSDLWKFLPKDQQSAPKLDKDWNVRVITASQHQVTQNHQAFKTSEELNRGETYSETRKEFSPVVSHTNKQPVFLGIAKPFNSFYDLAQLWADQHHFPHMNQTMAARLKPPARLMSKTGHFAPYINLPLAEQLLYQVKRCDGQNENGWLLSAILACEADELLLGMSEYSGLEAIRFLHRSEVMAEIESIGLSGRIKIDHRKREINQLVKTRYGNDISRQDQFLSRFWDDCRTLYKNSEQFLASEQANIESFSKRKWFHSSPWAGQVEEWLRKGMILCASSLGAWSAFWLISNALFFILYCFLLDHQLLNPMNFMYQVYISSLIGEPSFGFTESLGPTMNHQLKLIVFMHFGCSYILFGFFLSMVYRRITRS